METAKTTDLENGNKNNTAIILGDSIIKNVVPWRLRKRLDKNNRLFIHAFPSATISDMTSYCIPSIEKKPNNFILHCGTNDLKSDKPEVVIATELISLGKSIKAKGMNVTISGLVTRGENF